jgi:hypothetical protein
VSRTLFLGGVLTLLTATPAFAQYSQLAATDDGKQLYFISKQVLKGKQQGDNEPRLYRATSEGVTLFAERGDLAAEGSRYTGVGVESPSISGDGSLVAAVFRSVCLDPPDCNQTPDEAFLRGARSLDLGPAAVQISRNRKWATLTTTESQYAPGAGWTDRTTKTLMDLTIGAKVKVFSGVDNAVNAGLVNALASDGTVFVFTPNAPDPGGLVSGAFGLWKGGKTSPLNLPADFSGYEAVLSDDASTLVANTYGSQTRSAPGGLAAIDLRTGVRRTILPNSDQTPCITTAGVSNNGGRVLYRVCDGYTTNGRSFVWDAATGATIPVPLEPRRTRHRRRVEWFGRVCVRFDGPCSHCAVPDRGRGSIQRLPGATGL